MPTGRRVQWLIFQPSAALWSIFSRSILDQWSAQKPCSRSRGERGADLQGQWHAQALHQLGHERHPHREWVKPVPTYWYSHCSKRSPRLIFHTRRIMFALFEIHFNIRLHGCKYSSSVVGVLQLQSWAPYQYQNNAFFNETKFGQKDITP